MKKKKIAFVSPHLDDAVFSVGGVMAALAEEGHVLHVITCFTQSVLAPTGFALACQLDKGLSAEVDYMELRRAEDAQACQLLGAQPYWLDFSEAPHRGYESASALFADILVEDTIQTALREQLQQTIASVSPDLILSPIGIGNHVDHQQVKQVVKILEQHFPAIPFLYWYDEPYLSRHPSAYPDQVEIKHSAGWEILALQAARSNATVISIDIAPYWDRKIVACAAYASQVGFQFGGSEGIGAVLAKNESEQGRFTELIV